MYFEGLCHGWTMFPCQYNKLLVLIETFWMKGNPIPTKLNGSSLKEHRENGKNKILKDLWLYSKNTVIRIYDLRQIVDLFFPNVTWGYHTFPQADLLAFFLSINHSRKMRDAENRISNAEAQRSKIGDIETQIIGERDPVTE